MDVTAFILILLKISFTNCKMEGFIVGGKFVKSMGDFPYVAALALDSADGEFICGSSILNQLIILTAAHCFEDVTSGIATVGNVNRLKGSGHRIYCYKKHERYNPDLVRNDVALCRLRVPLKFGNTVQKVLLMKNPPHSEHAKIAGWGATEEVQFTGTDVLKHTDQRIWTNKKCRTVYVESLPEGTICGGEKHTKTNLVSKGDSGSGLVVDDNIIIGLISFKNFQYSRSLVVYTDTAYFYDWIILHAQRLQQRTVNN